MIMLLYGILFYLRMYIDNVNILGPYSTTEMDLMLKNGVINQ